MKLDKFTSTPIVYCNNIAGLIEQIKRKRSPDADDDEYIKLGIDGGGGFMKITLSVVPKTPVLSSKPFKESGVKRLHIVALAPNLTEKYEYISLIWNLLKLNDFKYVVAGDLKIINIIVGIMAHSSSNPCPYCEVKKINLASESGTPRTIRSIKLHSASDVTSKKRQNHASCIHAPLVSGQEEEYILKICPPPPLHIMLGIVNVVFRAVEKGSPDWADLWANKAQVRHQQRAYGFTGRACHSLIGAANVLEDNEDLLGYCKV